MNQRTIRVGIVAGEASGDILAAGLLDALKKQYPNAEFEGIAGPKMQAVGCKSLFDMEELSVMGIVEVLGRIKRLLYIRKTLVKHFLDNPPDVFIGVDAPDFNLGLERRLKAKGIKTVHYVSPTVWAWREKRIFKIAKATNLVLSLFPFEKAFYDKHQVPCAFVGHTLADEVPLDPDVELARKKLQLETSDKVLAMLPGSRGGEVGLLLQPFVDTALRLIDEYPDLKVLVPVVNRARHDQVRTFLMEQKVPDNIRIVIGHSREVMTASNAILLASGTATLEALLCKKPMVVAYKVNALTMAMARRMYKAKYFALPNLLADEPLVPELLQEEVEPVHMAALLSDMLKQPSGPWLDKFGGIHAQLKQDADATAAKAVAELLETST